MILLDLSLMDASQWLRALAERLDNDTPVIYTSEWGIATLLAMTLIFSLIGLGLVAFLVLRLIFRRIRAARIRRQIRRQMRSEW